MDGIRFISQSMMNTVRVELTNSISPDLSWNVSKGYRSAPRRRKPVDKGQKLGEPANRSTKSPSETTVSESEKVSTLVHCLLFCANSLNVKYTYLVMQV